MIQRVATYFKEPILAAAGVLFGILSDWSFYRKDTGLAFPIFTIAGLGVTVLVAYLYGKRFSRVQWWLVIPILGFAVAPAARANEVTNSFAVIATMFLGLLFFSEFYNKSLVEFNVLDCFAKPFWTVIESLAGAHKRWRHWRLIERIRSGKLQTFARVMKGTAVAVPILILFILLFSAADLIFKRYITELFTFDDSRDIIRHLLFVSFFSLVAFGFLSLIFSAELTRKEAREAAATTGSQGHYFIESSVVLFLLNGLFLSFVFIQFRYLFGSSDFISGQGLTYSAYARRGFYELLTAAGISFLVVYLIDRMMEQLTAKRRRVHQVLSTIMVLQVFVLIASAVQRLALYVEAYSLTQLRLYSYIVAAWLAVIFLLLLVTILHQRMKRYLLISIFVVTIIFSLTTVLSNTDGVIAATNINLYRSGKAARFDTYYLGSLSEDAWPVTLTIFDFGDEKQQGQLADAVHYRIVRRLIRGGGYSHGPWQEWNRIRSGAPEAFAPYKSKYQHYYPLMNPFSHSNIE